MADEDQGAEFREFVEGTVSLEELHRSPEGEDGASFESFVARFSGAAGELRFSFISGATMLAVAALLAATLPGQQTANDGFWRVGREAVGDLLGLGDGLLLPLALAALALLLASMVAAARGGELARGTLLVQPFLGGAGLAGVGIIWALFLVLVVANLAVLALIIVAYAVLTVIAVALVFGFFIGFLTQ